MTSTGENIILSRSNPKVKFVRALRQRRNEFQKDDNSTTFIIEGIHHIGQAAQAVESRTQADQAGLEFVAVYYAPQLLTSDFANQLIKEQREKGVPCLALTNDVFTSITDKENPQGILAVVRQPRPKLNSFNPNNFHWGVALVSPQDPGNVGTILRTIDAVGASGLLLLDECVDITHPTAVRASMGALFWLPVVRVPFSDFINWIQLYGYQIYATSAQATIDYHQALPYKQPGILLMGSEREGLSSEQRLQVLQAGGQIVKMPMHGKVSSLNLAVATGVMLYAMLGE